MTLLLFSVILFVIAAAGQYILGEIGVAITAFLLGTFGFFVYPLLASLVYASLVLITDKKPVSGKWFLRITAMVCAAFLIVHLATSTRFFGNGYGAYLSGCWKAASERAGDSTGGGILFGLIVYPVRAMVSTAGAYVLFSFLTALSVFFFLWATPLKAVFVATRNRSEKEKKKELHAPQKEGNPVTSMGVREYPGSIAFDDLDTGARQPSAYEDANGGNNQPSYYPAQPYPQYPQAEQSYPQYPQAGVQPNAQQPYAQYDPYRNDDYSQSYQQPYEPTGRDILFSSDPAANYRSNLIFNRDSAFNAQPRRSSMLPDDSPTRKTDFGIPSVYERPVQPQRPHFDTSVSQSSLSQPPQQSTQFNAPAAQPPQSYRSAYGEQAETSRSAMPRKIIEQKPSPGEGYSLRASDLNYPQIPSYKAPEASPERKDRDYYANDVPLEDFSSAPNVTDLPDEPLSENKRIFNDTFLRESGKKASETREVKRAPVDPEPEPLKTEPTRTFSERGLRGMEETREDPELFNRKAERSVDGEEQNGSLERDAFDFGRRDRMGAIERKAEPDQTIVGFGGRGGRNADDFGEDIGETTIGFGSRGVTGKALDFGDDEDVNENVDLKTPSFHRSPRVSDSVIDDSRVPDILRESTSRANIFDETDEPEEIQEPPLSFSRSDGIQRDYGQPAQEIPSAPAPKPHKHVYKKYKAPSWDLFRQYDDTICVSQEEIIRNSDIIVETLSGFRVDAEIIKVTPGPSVTRYDIDIPRNISVRSVIKHDEEIAMRLHARDGVNIYSNSEVGAISIEVPNAKRAVVGIRSVMQAEEFRNAKPGSLMFAIGKDVEGRNVCGNIPKMTHILVAGSTNSGKSVCLNAMLVSLVCKYSPEDLRLILIDPKKVEFTVYDGLPHLMINEIIADAQKAVSALNWAIKEMERRYELFEQKTRSGTAVRNLDEYNSVLSEDEQKLAKIVIVVDELADLMSVSKKDIEERIQRLTQKGRASGIHLVIATQRPSVDVITGVIKGNLPTRMAFRVIQEVDSRTILDESGAEKLLGNGDMLYKTGGMFNCSRVQGAFLSSEEVQSIVENIKANNEAYFDPDVADYINKTDSGDGGVSDDGDADGDNVNQEYIKALAISVKLGTTSISLIQRKCSVGYNHAGKIIEWMELMGYITPFDGKAKARTVLLTKEEFESKYGSLD